MSLHQAVWQTDLEKRLFKVDECEDLKYLPPTEVRNFQLEVLGCRAETILIREEYDFILKELEMCQPKLGGLIVAGQPGIGTSLLQTNMDCLAHVVLYIQENQYFYFIYFSVSFLLSDGKLVAPEKYLPCCRACSKANTSSNLVVTALKSMIAVPTGGVSNLTKSYGQSRIPTKSASAYVIRFHVLARRAKHSLSGQPL